MHWTLTALLATTCLATACKPPVDDTDTDDTDTTALDPGDLMWLATGGGVAGDACTSVAPAGPERLVAACSFIGFTKWGRGTAGETELISVGETDALLLGLDRADGAIRWAVPIGSDGEDSTLFAAAVALGGGRVAVAVELGGPAVVPGVNLDDVAPGDNVLFVVDADGTVDAAVRLSTSVAYSDMFTASLSPRPGGGLLVAANSTQAVTVMPGSAGERTLASTGEFDGFLLWLDADLELQRVDRLSAPGGGVVAKAVALDDGGVALAGYLDGTLTLGSSAPESITASDDGDAFVARLDAAGEPAWAFAFGSNGQDYATGLAPTADGGFVATGYTSYGGDGTLAVGTLDALSGDPGGSADMFVLGLGGDGTPRWLRGISSAETDVGYHLAAFDDGAVAVVANVNNHDRVEGPGEARFSDGETASLPGTSTALVRYEADGTRGWTRLAPLAVSVGVGVLDDGSVVEGSGFYGGGKYGVGGANETEPVGAGGWDGAVVRYAP